MRKILIFISPLIALVVSYFIEDPFAVLYNYDNHWENTVGAGSQDYFTTERFLNNVEDGNVYDSYIFGSSRSQAFRAVEWAAYLEKDKNKVYHFDASSETLYGIYGKVKLLDELNLPIKNVLLPIDIGMLSLTTNNLGRLSIKHPRISGQSNYEFQKIFFSGYFEDFFFIEHLYYRITGDVLIKENGKVDNRPMRYNKVTNDIIYDFYDFRIKRDSVAYYKMREENFKNNIGDSLSMLSKPMIDSTGLRMLKEIQEIFEKKGTNFKIILYPVTSKKVPIKADMYTLRKIFGKENIYDFSHREEMIKRRNFYEKTHFKPFLAREMLKEVYGRGLNVSELKFALEGFEETKYEFLDAE